MGDLMPSGTVKWFNMQKAMGSLGLTTVARTFLSTSQRSLELGLLNSVKARRLNSRWSVQRTATGPRRI